MNNATTIPKGRIVDLTHILYPDQEQYTLEVSRRSERHGEEGDIMSAVYLWSHVGTHVEAPLHYWAQGADAAGLPIERLMGPAIVLDFREKNVNEAITLADVQAAGDVEKGDRVLIMTGRDVQYRTETSHDRPYVAEEAMRWLVEDRQMSCLGTDSSGFEVRGTDDHPDHRLLTRAGVPVIECMAHLVELTRQRVFLIALPWPVVGLDSCPVRAIAIEPAD